MKLIPLKYHVNTNFLKLPVNSWAKAGRQVVAAASAVGFSHRAGKLPYQISAVIGIELVINNELNRAEPAARADRPDMVLSSTGPWWHGGASVVRKPQQLV
ncbi:hypothetical protein [Aquitalea sp. ASV15]|uniref:hypothetical protein n=1 Tax=Aquitalea sp. ASV15 TaxID=2795104 RepID=UPI0018EC9761|nr:hypothetical protein [Aquitalea sp. ASV15]